MTETNPTALEDQNPALRPPSRIEIKYKLTNEIIEMYPTAVEGHRPRQKHLKSDPFDSDPF